MSISPLPTFLESQGILPFHLSNLVRGVIVLLLFLAKTHLVGRVSLNSQVFFASKAIWPWSDALVLKPYPADKLSGL